MTKLAKLAGASKLKGTVCVTDTKGFTHHYADEAAAEAAWGDRADKLMHRRGAFFETGKSSTRVSPPVVAVPIDDDEPIVVLDEERSSRSSKKKKGKRGLTPRDE